MELIADTDNVHVGLVVLLGKSKSWVKCTFAYSERKLPAGKRRVPHLIAYFDLLLIHGPYL